ncbi:YceD family protein [Pseudolactococcus reticulitermitis]|uniref:DUF177 domain-containing protein n=1 Tax=Pseudolactococcus reticulitermitis TaxID=2025039 RepID=A0A224XDC5_9LACT|nr:YceD family protein [Lactococcus reticulitermitis]GAX47912.1 hypothetical protein RsY01_1516 [Lactococcus reticulitermitis]
MKWSLQELNKKHSVEFETVFDLKQELTSREPEILDVSPVVVNGRVDADGGIYSLSFTADYTLTMPSSRSLTPVEVPLTLTVSEIFTTQAYFEAHQADLDADMLFILDKDLIDLAESVADNILLEIPLRVLTDEEKQSDALPSGSAWQVLSEDDYAALQTKSAVEDVEKKSPFSQLNGLFE